MPMSKIMWLTRSYCTVALFDLVVGAVFDVHVVGALSVDVVVVVVEDAEDDDRHVDCHLKFVDVDGLDVLDSPFSFGIITLMIVSVFGDDAEHFVARACFRCRIFQVVSAVERSTQSICCSLVVVVVIVSTIVVGEPLALKS